MLLLDDEDVLSEEPSADEVAFRTVLAADGIAAVENAIVNCVRPSWLKVARIVYDALSQNGQQASDPTICLYARTVGVLVERGILQAQGDLRRPRWCEVRLSMARDA